MYDWCDKAYDHVKQLDEEYSNWLCIPKSVRMTSIKPSGTVSLLNGSTPEYTFQRMNTILDELDSLKTIKLLENLSEKQGIILKMMLTLRILLLSSFLYMSPISQKEKRRSMWEQLEIAAQYQHYWADNSVSITVTFKPDEAPQIKTALELYETRLKAVSFLRYEETGYEQAPYEAISQRNIQKWLQKCSPIKRVDIDEGGSGTKFCTNDTCEI
jgi:ribonucleoside-triphosphate reductase